MIVPSEVEYISHMGGDKFVCDVARVSFDALAQDYSEERNNRLIAYLAQHGHWSPFAHCYVSFRFTAPIFVARQLVKHRVGLEWNEVSRRYVDYSNSYWSPTEWRAAPDKKKRKQGSDGTFQYQDVAQSMLNEVINTCDVYYDRAIELGVAPEQARAMLPVGSMTKWIWTGSLMAWSRVWKQRVSEHAQLECQEVVEQIGPKMTELFPVSWQALLDN